MLTVGCFVDGYLLNQESDLKDQINLYFISQFVYFQVVFIPDFSPRFLWGKS